MRVGVPKEIKSHEYRVGLVPSGVLELTKRGHQVMIQKGAGVGIGIEDKLYQEAGAIILNTAEEVFEQAEMVVKVKEPQAVECKMMREGQTLFTYLHLAPDPEQTDLLMESGCTAIAYETVTDDAGHLPLLSPMSEVAGRMSVQAGAHSLEKAQAGSGILLGGIPGVAAAHVVVIGGGVVGTNAVRMAIGLEAQVVVLDKNINRLRELNDMFGARLTTIYATEKMIAHHVSKADLVIGAVLVAGGSAPRLVTREMLNTMRPGSVLVDVSIDQGGCFESSRVTTHAEPTYVENHIVHYCVANMPGAVPRTATFGLTNATLPYVLNLADKGISPALHANPHLLNGLNVHRGEITHVAVARALDRSYTPPLDIL